MLYQVITVKVFNIQIGIFSDVIKNFVMNADFVVPYQFAQLVTNISSETQRKILLRLKVRNLEQFLPKLDF